MARRANPARSRSVECDKCNADEWVWERDRRRTAGGSWRCYPCKHRTHLRRRFGITPKQYTAMFKAQEGACAICDRPPTRRQRLSVDHDHETGKVRGLLCQGCNMALGLFGDNAAWLRAAISYLRDTKG